MPNKSAKLKIESLKRLKSAYILEAKASKTRGWDSAASALFLRAGQLEMELVELFRSQDDEKNARVSLLSAGSCLLQAQQYQTAIETLRQVAEQFPEARESIAECEGKQNVPLAATTTGLQALIDLLVKKKLIEEGEWAEAVAGR